MSAVAAVILGAAGHVFTGSAAAAHYDVVPYWTGTSGTMLTGGRDDLDALTEEFMSVFGYDFGDGGTPHFASDPGINNSSNWDSLFPNNNVLPSGSLRLSLFSGPYSTLHYWSGTGSPAFSPVAGGVEINLNRFSDNLRVGATTTSGTFPITTVGVTGRVHLHLTSSIGVGGTGGSFTGGTLGAPDGIYAFGAILSLSGTAPLTSDPIYFVFNQRMSESVHDEAIDFYNVAVVPEPSGVILAVGGIAVAGGLLRRRLRRQK
jgi:hypothetical protein